VSRGPVILVTGVDLAAPAREVLAGYELVFAGTAQDEEALVALCEHHQPVAIVLRYGRITARVMDAAKTLRVISKHGSGIDTIDLAAAEARGIAVRAAAGANADAVAEHAWALILGCAKDLVTLDARMRAGFWDKATHKSLELSGKTLGVVGLGAIGRRVAAIGHAMGMQVVAHDPVATGAPAGVELLPLAEVLSRSQVLSLNCPLTESNRHMINRASLATMPRGAILVNTGRGGLIDDDAVREALSSGHLRAAGLDAFTPEPLAGEHAWRDSVHTILTPHVGGVSEDAYVKMGVGAARNVLAVLEPSAAAA
jgi:D-3-phosphoglycerate dehydrogenase